MTAEPLSIRRAIEDYIWVVETPDLAPERRLEALSRSLDALASAFRETDFTFDERDYADAPRDEYQDARALLIRHFPSLGHYNLADPMTRRIGEGSIIVGDGIDDITDILADVKEALWRWDNTSVDDALWCFTQGFSSHWGLHLRELQLYLHVLSSGADESVG